MPSSRTPAVWMTAVSGCVGGDLGQQRARARRGRRRRRRRSWPGRRAALSSASSSAAPGASGPRRLTRSRWRAPCSVARWRARGAERAGAAGDRTVPSGSSAAPRSPSPAARGQARHERDARRGAASCGPRRGEAAASASRPRCRRCRSGRSGRGARTGPSGPGPIPPRPAVEVLAAGGRPTAPRVTQDEPAVGVPLVGEPLLHDVRGRAGGARAGSGVPAPVRAPPPAAGTASPVPRGPLVTTAERLGGRRAGAGPSTEATRPGGRPAGWLDGWAQGQSDRGDGPPAPSATVSATVAVAESRRAGPARRWRPRGADTPCDQANGTTAVVSGAGRQQRCAGRRPAAPGGRQDPAVLRRSGSVTSA